MLFPILLVVVICTSIAAIFRHIQVILTSLVAMVLFIGFIVISNDGAPKGSGAVSKSLHDLTWDEAEKIFSSSLEYSTDSELDAFKSTLRKSASEESEDERFKGFATVWFRAAKNLNAKQHTPRALGLREKRLFEIYLEPYKKIYQNTQAKISIYR